MITKEDYIKQRESGNLSMELIYEMYLDFYDKSKVKEGSKKVKFDEFNESFAKYTTIGRNHEIAVDRVLTFYDKKFDLLDYDFNKIVNKAKESEGQVTVQGKAKEYKLISV